MAYLIVDAIRLQDLMRMDTVASTPAEAMAKQYGVTVSMLAPVGVVEGAVEPRWEKAIPGADVSPGGWIGGGTP